MLSGDFLHALKSLNPKLRVYSRDGSGKMAGIYYIDKEGIYQDVCAIDKNMVPEFPEYDEEGHLTKCGWRRAVFILLQNKLTTFRRVRRLWPGFFLRREPQIQRNFVDPVKDKVKKYMTDDPDMAMSHDEILDVAETIRKKDPDHIKQDREEDKWFLKKWRKKGGNRSDRPK